MRRITALFLAFCLLLPVGVSTVSAAEGTDDGWKMQISQLSISAQLATEQVLTSYDGTTYTENYVDNPGTGNCFAVVVLSLQKDSAQAASLDLSKIRLVVDETEYAPMRSSAFLKHHNYDVFDAGTVLVSDTGALCFEIPASYLQSTGNGWYVSYGAGKSAPYVSDGVIEVPVRKNDVDIQEDYEAAILKNYKAKGPLALKDAMIVQDVYHNAPLTAIALFDTNAACGVTVTVHGKNSAADITYTVGDKTAHHEVPIFGLYAGQKNRVTISAGNQSHDFYITTDPIPESVTTKITASEGNDITKIADGQLYMLQEVYHTIFDVNGDVRWYLGDRYTSNVSLDYSTSFTLDENNSGFWFAHSPSTGWGYSNNTEFIHMNWMGKVLQQFSYQDRCCNHDATLLPDGSVLYFGLGSILNRIDPSTGEMTDYIDFEQYFDANVGNLDMETAQDPWDWAHVNSVEYISENDSLLISLRNQHLVFNMDYDTKEILWAMTPAYTAIDGVIQAKQPVLNDVLILPAQANEEFEWFYCQHMPSFVAYDAQNEVFEFVLFDNGSYRWVAGEEPNDLVYSRVVHYSVDLKSRTVKQVFQYGKEEGERLYSMWYGSACKISSSGHYLGNFKCHNNVYPHDSIVVEIDEQQQVVAEYTVFIPDDNFGSYRANPLFLTGSSLGDCHFGSNPGITYMRYNQAEWNDSASPEVSERTFSAFNLNEFYTDGSYLYTYGTVMVADSAETVAYEVVAVDQAGTAYQYTMGTCEAARGQFYGRGIPLDSLPDGEYLLYIRGTNEQGATASQFTGYQLKIGGEQVENTDILCDQSETDQAIAALYARGTYTLQAPYVVVDPYGISPLSAIALFSTAKPSSISIEVEGRNGAAPLRKNFETVSTQHQIPIYGLYAGEAAQVTLTARYADGTAETSVLSLTGNDLADGFVPVRVVQADAAQMAEGWTFLEAGSMGGYAYAIDETGAVRWFLNQMGTGTAGRFLSLKNGNFLIGGDKSFGSYYKYSFFELDLTGRVVHEYLLDGIHHGAAEMTNGNLLVLANNTNGAVVEDTIYEINRSDGRILRTWDMNSYFNVGNRNENGAHISDVNYGSSAADWLHLNSIDYDAQSNTVLLSSRQQDAVIKLDLSSGEIVWILSDPNDIWPEYLSGKLLSPAGGEFEWQYGQHCVTRLPNGDLMLFDNGDYRSKTPDGILDAATKGYSRAVIYRIDEENMTVSQVWQFGKELGPDHLSPYISSAWRLAEDHYLINFGGIAKNSDGQATYNLMEGITGSSRSEVYELKDGKIIFHAALQLESLGGNTFQAERIVPYQNVQELTLTDAHSRIGALYRYGAAEKVSFDAAAAVPGGPEVTVADNGVQLVIAAELHDDSAGSPALIFAAEHAAYRIALPAEASISYTLNSSEIPVGAYDLYWELDGTAYNLGLKWENRSAFRPFPASFQVDIAAGQAAQKSAYGSGIYYDDTAFVLSAEAGSRVDITKDTGKEYALASIRVMDMNGSTYQTEILESGGIYSFVMPDSEVSVIVSFQKELPFVDVTESSWYYDAVEYVSSAGVMTGTSGTTFAPAMELSRGMIAAILWRLEGSPKGFASAFGDVDAGTWYAEGVNWAAAQGIVNGYRDDRFGPDDGVTREQIATILYRYKQAKGYGNAASGSLAGFTDGSSTSDWAVEAMSWAVDNGLLSGKGGGILDPSGASTRAEAAAILMRFCQG